VNWNAIRTWIAVALLLDAAFGLWNHERLRQIAPNIPVARMALIEAGIALLLVLLNRVL
jgi:hypothetical protein